MSNIKNMTCTIWKDLCMLILCKWCICYWRVLMWLTCGQGTFKKWIILEVQPILQNNLQTVDVVSDHW